MKLKNLFLAAGLALAVGATIGGAINLTGQAVETQATATIYNLAGTHNGWANNDHSVEITDGGSAVPVTFSVNQEFKFVHDDGWAGALAYSTLQLASSAKSWFVDDGSSDHNYLCKVAGTYNVKISSALVYIDLQTSTDVYVQVSGWEHTYVYMFDETTDTTKLESLGVWPGTEVSNLTQATNFNSTLGGIAKVTVPYKTLGNTKIIVTNNAGSQSGNQALGSGYYYWNDGAMGDATYGAEAKVVYDIEKAVFAATNSSVCAVAKATASALVDEYDGLAVKARVDASTVYTWDKVVGDSKSNHTYPEVIAQLRTIANAKGDLARISVGLDNENNNLPILLAVVATSVVALAVGGYLFFRAKRKSE